MKKTFLFNKTSRRQEGISLIEVLIAVLLLSIGFLGVAALVASGTSTNTSAMTRSMASFDLYSMMDMLRMDPAMAQGGKYNTTVKASACPVVDTTSTNMTSQNLNTWCKQLAQDLGKRDTTTGTIACDDQKVCTVTIVFDDSKAGLSGKSKQTVTSKAML